MPAHPGYSVKVKPHPQRAESITSEEAACHHWIGRLSMCLALVHHDLPPHLKAHVRKTLDEFLASGAPTESLAQHVREEVER